MGFIDLRKSMKYIFCPVCGHFACKCDNGLLEEECARCKNIIVINVKDDMVLLFKSRRQAERRAGKA